MNTDLPANRIVARVRAALAAIAESDRPEAWISLRTEQQAVGAAREIEEALLTGVNLRWPDGSSP